MATNNSNNNTYTNNADGFALAGGTTARTLTLTAGSVTLSAGGANTFTMPAASDTLVGRASTDTLTNKTLTSPVINQFGTASGLGAAWTAWTPTVTAGSGTFTTATGAGRYTQIGKTVHYQASLTVTTIGSGSGCVFTLPQTAQASTNVGLGTGREDALTGNMCFVKLASSTTGTCSRYDNGNIVSGGSGSVIRVYGTYEAA